MGPNTKATTEATKSIVDMRSCDLLTLLIPLETGVALGPLEGTSLRVGASIIGCFVTFPLAILSNQFVNPFVPWNSAHYALVFSSIIHGIVYATYVWLVTKVGAVFAAQVSYFVTVAGVVWSMVILDEVHSKFIWMSLVCMILGMALVKPRSQ